MENGYTYTVSRKVLSEWAKTIVGCLGSREEPASARWLAGLCGVTGGHETVRRRMREAVSYAREELGWRICAGRGGYWLARNAAEWEAYKAAAGRKARFTFVRLSRAQRAASERISQQGRFEFARASG